MTERRARVFPAGRPQRYSKCMLHFAWSDDTFEWLPVEVLKELRDRLKSKHRPIYDDHKLILIACIEDTIRWSPRRESTEEELANIKARLKKQHAIQRKIRRAKKDLFAKLNI